MKSHVLGKNTSAPEVVNVSSHGVWLNVGGDEYFMPYLEYPWFRDATIAQIQNVSLVHGRHLHWVDLDVDLDVDSLSHPEKYPLTYR